jgi:hypothetical protein
MTVIRRDDYEPATEHERVRRRIQAALKGEEYSIAEMAADLERLTDQLAGAVDALYTAHDFIGRVSKWTGDTEDEQAEVLAEIARHLPQGGQ